VTEGSVTTRHRHDVGIDNPVCHALRILMDVLFIWGCGGVGGASGEECSRKWLEEDGYL